MRFTTTAALAAVMILATGSAVAPARAQSGYEAEPVLRAQDLVAPELLKGPSFTVDERVPVRGYLARFTIRSTHGVFEAHGIHMLQIRVREMYALTQLDEMSKTKEFTDAAARAIARPVESTVNMITHPVETVTGLPDGVSRLFHRAGRRGDRERGDRTRQDGHAEGGRRLVARGQHHRHRARL